MPLKERSRFLTAAFSGVSTLLLGTEEEVLHAARTMSEPPEAAATRLSLVLRFLAPFVLASGVNWRQWIMLRVSASREAKRIQDVEEAQAKEAAAAAAVKDGAADDEAGSVPVEADKKPARPGPAQEMAAFGARLVPQAPTKDWKPPTGAQLERLRAEEASHAKEALLQRDAVISLLMDVLDRAACQPVRVVHTVAPCCIAMLAVCGVDGPALLEGLTQQQAQQRAQHSKRAAMAAGSDSDSTSSDEDESQDDVRESLACFVSHMAQS